MKRLLISLFAFVAIATAALRADTPAALPETCYLFSYFYHDRQADGLRLAWSRDGSLLASGGSDGEVMVWDTQTGARAAVAGR